MIVKGGEKWVTLDEPINRRGNAIQKVMYRGRLYYPEKQEPGPGPEESVFRFRARGTTKFRIYGESIVIDFGDGTITDPTDYTLEYKIIQYAIVHYGRNAYRHVPSPYVEHAFNDNDDHVVSIYGNPDYLYFHVDKGIIEVLTPFPKSIKPTDFTSVFGGCTNLEKVPNDLFVNCPDIETFHSTFSNSGLLSIPDGLFKNMKKAVIFSNCFEDCHNLKKIEGSPFENCSARVFEYCFSRCDALSEITGSVFKNCNNAENFQACFTGCNSLVSIPEGAKIFSGCTNAVNLSHCFGSCEKLKNIPGDIFAGACDNAADFSYCFFWCFALETLPSELFDNCESAITFSYCFSRCESLKSIPQGLFDDCINAEDFSYCFYRARLIDKENTETSPRKLGFKAVRPIPESLFANCKKAKTFEGCFQEIGANSHNYDIIISKRIFAGSNAEKFSHCFYQMGFANVWILEWIFEYCNKAKDFSFCFAGSRIFPEQNHDGICGIPDYLFAHCINAETYESCFENAIVGANTWKSATETWDAIFTIPDHLFYNNYNVKSYKCCFKGCALSSVSPNIFRDSRGVEDVTECFNIERFEDVGGNDRMHGNIFTHYYTGQVPELWKEAAYWTVPVNHLKCFASCTRASNYSDIPDDWK